MREFSEQELVRREKLKKFQELGIDPFGQRYDVSCFSDELKEKYSNLCHEDLEKENIKVSVAGRIMFIRKMGKASFFTIQDKMGSMQIYISINDVNELEYDLFKSADIGDIVGVEGILMKTKTNELTIKCLKYIHLVKALKPLPEKYHGLIDVEERFRRRYVDLIMNEDARKIAFARPKIVRSIQKYLDNQGYIEVETPILGTILGGAAARPFITHHNAQNIDMYLRIATELNLKRLLVGGMDAVYEIGRIFRNEGMDKKHNPEFTTIEVYKAFSDLEGMMDITEGIISTCAMELNGTYDVEFKGHKISLAPGFKRAHMVDLIKEQTGIDFFKVNSTEEALELAKKHHVDVENHFTYGHIVNAFFEKFVEDTIVEPTFVFGHPLEISPLAKKDLNDERFTQRFELFIIGSEYANAFTELNDPIDQMMRFEAQLKEKELGNDEANDMDLDFVEALEYGMPPAGGMGMGIDRLVMLLTNCETIREVILFPTMKPRD
ncbi:MAG: lysine--tRNA ligase [Firmicutes bacterium]|nr:lysine--tRNA ligase [Bacillota bacterium]